MKVLVTGGLGSVGAPLVRELRARGHEVWVCDLPHAADRNYMRCDVSQVRQLHGIFAKHQFEMVYHLAAEFGRLNGEDFYETLWQSNAIGTKNMLVMQAKYNFRMVFTSSSEVYGDYDGIMYEDVPHQRAIRQLNDYAISKWVGELQIVNAAERYGTKTVRVRLFNTYGPGERYSEYRGMICRFVHHALHDLPYTVYLNHHRTSTYIDDTVRTLANITDSFRPGEVYNISGDEYHDVKTLSDMILNYLGRDDSLVTYKEAQEHTTRDKKADNSKARRDLNHKCRVPLEEGIPLTIEWQRVEYGIG
jgi:dTDP-glucose 4,6-dehydratase